MNRFFTVIMGEGRELNKPLTSSLMIVGRSKNADLQIEDALVSRRHLEVRIEADAVFVENLSTAGSSLNGKPLVGVVSLNPGDIIEIGSTKLRYDEASAEASPPSRAPSVPAMESDLEGTRIADENVELHRPRDREAEPDATRAIVESDGTRMLNAAELPNWVAQEKLEKPASAKGSLTWVLLVVVLLGVVGAGYWYWSNKVKGNESSGAMMAYKDSLFDFKLAYPLEWSKKTDEAGVVGYGFGKPGDQGWVQVTFYTDKKPEHALTGLTDGFVHYRADIKTRYPDAELNLKDSKPKAVNGCKVLKYSFGAPQYQATGIYTLNAEARIVVECVCSRKSYSQYESVFEKIIKSFQLGDSEQQQVIDFPLPDDGMQQFALANPEGLSRQVDDVVKRGEMLLASKDVKPDNLFEAVQQFRKALQLAIAPPQRLPAYPVAAKDLATATTLLNQCLAQQLFEIRRALMEGDKTAAYWAANKLMQMLPDKTDNDYQVAYNICQHLK